MKGTVTVVELQAGDTKAPRLTRVRVERERRCAGLAPGRYRLRLTAYDDADNASRPAFAWLAI